MRHIGLPAVPFAPLVGALFLAWSGCGSEVVWKVSAKDAGGSESQVTGDGETDGGANGGAGNFVFNPAVVVPTGPVPDGGAPVGEGTATCAVTSAAAQPTPVDMLLLV